MVTVTSGRTITRYNVFMRRFSKSNKLLGSANLAEVCALLSVILVYAIRLHTWLTYGVFLNLHNKNYPVAIETAGTWDDMAIELVQEIGRRTTVITQDTRETVFLFQRLSVALQRGMRSPYSTQWTPNKKWLQPLFTILLSFHARGFVLSGLNNNTNNNNNYYYYLLSSVTMNPREV